MTPARRRPGTPASEGPTRTAPDVPIKANPPPVPQAKTSDDTELLGPEGEPITQEAAAQDAAEDRTTGQSPRRSGGLYPLPVWPD